MSDNNSSTAKSYLDSAVAQGQSALGSLTGSSGDKDRGTKPSAQPKNPSAASSAPKVSRRKVHSKMLKGRDRKPRDNSQTWVQG
ncbi:MAG: hypothetical protein Q9218_005595 [Villophora microphyllina]